MKIRGKWIDEVIKFSQVEADESAEVYHPIANIKEIEFIIAELNRPQGRRIAPKALGL